jgi:hypothetical protein
MVWTAIGYGLAAVAVVAGLLRDLSWRQDETGWKAAQSILEFRCKVAENELETAKTLLTDAHTLAAETLRKYDALVAKTVLEAAKPDNGIIHASNAAAVRRIFEREVSAQELKRDKEMEN